MKEYLDIVRSILLEGTRKESRTGVDTISTFGVHYKIDVGAGFPLLTTKEVSWKNIVVENLWFLSGDTGIDFLKRHNCKFWDAWADEDLKVPSAYGNFWRHFPVHGVSGLMGHFPMPTNDFNDQIRWVIGELGRNPNSRRLVVSAWAPNNAQTSKLPPCHCLWALNVQNMVVPPHREAYERDEAGSYDIEKKLCLHLTQRSCDVALGVPYNIAGYALILELMARFTGMKAGMMSHVLVDAHAYTSKSDGSMAESDHVPGLRQQLERVPRELPRLVIDESIRSLEDVEELIRGDVSTDDLMGLFRLEGYHPHPAIKFRVAV